MTRRIADHDRIFFITVRLGRGIMPLSPGERDIVQEYVAAERAAYKFLSSDTLSCRTISTCLWPHFALDCKLECTV